MFVRAETTIYSLFMRTVQCRAIISSAEKIQSGQAKRKRPHPQIRCDPIMTPFVAFQNFCRLMPIRQKKKLLRMTKKRNYAKRKAIGHTNGPNVNALRNCCGVDTEQRLESPSLAIAAHFPHALNHPGLRGDSGSSEVGITRVARILSSADDPLGNFSGSV